MICKAFDLFPKITLPFFLALVSFTVQAQPDSTAPSRPIFIAPANDTVLLQYFFEADLNQFYHLDDTLLNDFQQYDPTRQSLFYDYLQLGDVGSAHRPLAYTPIERRGFDVGLHLYDLYQFPYEKVKFFKVNRAYTDTYYSQASSQNDLIFKATFSNSMGKNGNLSFDYRRISEVGLYQKQKARHTNLVVNGWFQSENKRYTGLWAWVRNINEQENNGGIQSPDDLVAGLFGSRAAVAVNLSSSLSEIRNNQFIYNQYYALLPNADNLTLNHRIEYQDWSFKFYDTNPASDSSFYQNFQTNNQGIRNYINYQKIENEATVRLNYKGFLDVGIVHAYYDITQEPRDTGLNNLFLIGDWDLQFDKKQRYILGVKGHFGLLDNRADYLLQGQLKLDLGTVGKLQITARNQGYAPNLLQYRTFVSKEQLWENNFSKTIETQLTARYDWRKNIAISGRYYLLNNLIYWDSLALPQQTDTAVSIGQLMIHTKFNVGKFYFENTALVQQVTNNLLRFPTLATKHSFYFEGNVFKSAAFARIGIDARYNTAYFADDFQPVTGQFYQQNQENISILPIFDAFLSFKVRTFRAFVKLENLNSIIDGNQIYFTAPLYPMRDFTFRFGISWRFTDSNTPNTDNNNPNSTRPGFNSSGERYDQ